jgi:hypothetical protein
MGEASDPAVRCWLSSGSRGEGLGQQHKKARGVRSGAGPQASQIIPAAKQAGLVKPGAMLVAAAMGMCATSSAARRSNGRCPSHMQEHCRVNTKRARAPAASACREQDRWALLPPRPLRRPPRLVLGLSHHISTPAYL